jgi:hypothetical protein
VAISAGIQTSVPEKLTKLQEIKIILCKVS